VCIARKHNIEDLIRGLDDDIRNLQFVAYDKELTHDFLRRLKGEMKQKRLHFIISAEDYHSDATFYLSRDLVEKGLVKTSYEEAFLKGPVYLNDSVTIQKLMGFVTYLDLLLLRLISIHACFSLFLTVVWFRKSSLCK
jgi:hypothetical protein